ncbi:MAG: hypothetical protein JNJ56_08960 [Ignavibacteria bacterium]|nr:hypothetical protein [Ignavibacteria bacterium]
MIKYHKNKYAMYEAVLSFLEEGNSRYSDMPELISHKTDFIRKTNEIGLLEDLKNKSTVGRVKDKRVSRKSVMNQALAVAGSIRAYAKKTGNLTLGETMNISKSGFQRIRDTELIIELNSIHEKAEQNREALEGYGITADYFNSFTESINTYTKALGAKDTGKARKSGAVKTLPVLFGEADSILESIDLLMEHYIERDKEFYAGYKSARVIQNRGIRHETPEDGSNKNGKSQTEPELQNASEIKQLQQ